MVLVSLYPCLTATDPWIDGGNCGHESCEQSAMDNFASGTTGEVTFRIDGAGSASNTAPPTPPDYEPREPKKSKSRKLPPKRAGKGFDPRRTVVARVNVSGRGRGRR